MFGEVVPNRLDDHVYAPAAEHGFVQPVLLFDVTGRLWYWGFDHCCKRDGRRRR